MHATILEMIRKEIFQAIKEVHAVDHTHVVNLHFFHLAIFGTLLAKIGSNLVDLSWILLQKVNKRNVNLIRGGEKREKMRK